jgi:hypothetical protein
MLWAMSLLGGGGGGGAGFKEVGTTQNATTRNPGTKGIKSVQA